MTSTIEDALVSGGRTASAEALVFISWRAMHQGLDPRQRLAMCPVLRTWSALITWSDPDAQFRPICMINSHISRARCSWLPGLYLLRAPQA